mmetsp:Transcript_12432/g.35098  ORF Transcript_12432/g.35098 Transcript_12432/m.35098 type:complete len:389 (-) Transcript_12432:497-1663(-)
MARTQKNKATEGHLGSLKAKLAKLRTQLQEPAPGQKGAGEGFEVNKYGDGRIALIGFPSVGKSTLLSQLTGTDSEAAAYEFTTLTCIPGVIHYNDTKIQLLDLPGIIEGASQGKGRGRQVIAVCKSADLLLMVLDAAKSHGHKEILTRELEACGLRLNRSPPNIYFKAKKSGGIAFNSTVPLTRCDERSVMQILQVYRIHHAEVLFREDATVDDLIDVIEGNRRYVKCLYVYNKIDVCSIEEVDHIARQPMSVPISCYEQLNLDGLLKRIWEEMALVRIYTKPQGSKPDFEEPCILSEHRGGSTVRHLCRQLHRTLVKEFNYAIVWGKSAKHAALRCGLGHELRDEDVVQVVKKKKILATGEERGRFRQKSDAPDKISDRVKKAPLKT